MRFFLPLLMFSLASHTADARMSGFYLGAHGGSGLLKGEHKYKNGETGAEGKSKINKMGILFGLNAGYLRPFGNGRTFWGGELYASMISGSVRKQLQTRGGTLDGSVNIQPTRVMGIAAIVGTMINPKIALYGRIGFESQKFKLTYTDLTFQIPTSETYQKSVSGIAPGAGGLYKLTPHISAGGELIVPLLSKIEPRKSTETKNGVKRGFEYTPSQYRVMAKVIYHF